MYKKYTIFLKTIFDNKINIVEVIRQYCQDHNKNRLVTDINSESSYEELKIDDINYKQLLMDKLKELGKEYAKKNKLSSKTTQSIAKKLLESLVIK